MNQHRHDTDSGPLPVTGAWREGDDPGERRFVNVAGGRPFPLEGGGLLENAVLAYETWGRLNATASNAVLVCHALTGDSHAAGDGHPAHSGPGWWSDLIGPGAALDTDRYFVVCANVLGGCQGSSGPASVEPVTGRPYGSRFPQVSIRDNVRAQARLASHLGIPRWLAVVGGSMGGMQALEWAITFPDRVGGLVAMATTAAASAQQIAWSAAGRAAIQADSRWRGGDYYSAPPGEGPHEGLIAARIVGMIHYRSDEEFNRRFGRSSVERLDRFSLDHRFDVERYLRYQGEKLVRRFDANSYLVLNKAMDLHDVGRRRGGIRRALSRISGPLLSVSVSSDFLYPRYQQMEIVDAVAESGCRVEHIDIVSDNGHDGFLTETGQVSPGVSEFMNRLEKDLEIT